MDLYEHRILTPQQVFELHFGSYQHARKRLLSLYQLGLIDRIRPRHWPGSLPFHYMLDELGVHVVAAHKGIERDEIRFAKARTLALVDSQKLRHLRGANGFFARLAWACRRSEGAARLVVWLGEGASAARWKSRVDPDGIGVLRTAKSRIGFALEYDRSTQSLSRLEDKVQRYRGIVAADDAPDALLFCFLTDARERSARSVLFRPGIAVATTTIGRHRTDPLGPVWRPLDADARVPLAHFGEQGETDA